jgi:hypothetical protein
MWHNETVNVWTHFLGKLAALAILLYIWTSWPPMRKLGESIKLQAAQDMSLNSSWSLEGFVQTEMSSI